jgi:hypothetical protein
VVIGRVAKPYLVLVGKEQDRAAAKTGIGVAYWASDVLDRLQMIQPSTSQFANA